MKKFNSNSLGGGDCSGDRQFFIWQKPLSALCCVKKFNSNSLGGGDCSGDGQFFIWQSLCQLYAV